MGRGRFGGPWVGPTFGGRKMGGFWGGPGFGRRGGGWGRTNVWHPPVNIEETDNEYVISLFAAGLAKENVTLSVKNDVLTIAYPDVNADASAESNPDDKFTYWEYQQGPFERKFQLNNKVLVDGISASYTDGILKVVLPKNPETNQPAQTITVA